MCSHDATNPPRASGSRLLVVSQRRNRLRESFAFGHVTYEQAEKGFVTKRVMSPEEMARAVMFLASDEATSVTGMNLDVTGGQLAACR